MYHENGRIERIKKSLQIGSAGSFLALKQNLQSRRERERRNRRKNLWGNVSLLRGWQQHHHN
jgi:hypothetical protein